MCCLLNFVAGSELQMHNALYSNPIPGPVPGSGRMVSQRPFSPTQVPFQPGPGPVTSVHGPPHMTSGPAHRPNNIRGSEDMMLSGVAVSRPYPGDQQRQGPPAGPAEMKSPTMRPKTAPKPSLPPFMAQQVSTTRPAGTVNVGRPVGTVNVGRPVGSAGAATGKQPLVLQQVPQQRRMGSFGSGQPSGPRTSQYDNLPFNAGASGPQPGSAVPHPGIPGPPPGASGPHPGIPGPQRGDPSGMGYQQHPGITSGQVRNQPPSRDQPLPPWLTSNPITSGQVRSQPPSMDQPLPPWLTSDPFYQNDKMDLTYSMPASPTTSPGPDQWGQPYSLPTSPVPMLSPPEEERMQASSPVRQLAAKFEPPRSFGSISFNAKKQWTPYKHNVRLVDGGYLKPFSEPGRAYSPTKQQTNLPNQAPRPSEPSQPYQSPGFPRVLSPTIDLELSHTSRAVLSPPRQIHQVAGLEPSRVISPTPPNLGSQPARVLSPTRQIQQIPSRVLSPTQHLHGAKPRNLTQGSPKISRVFSPTKQLDVAASPPAKKAGLGTSNAPTKALPMGVSGLNTAPKQFPKTWQPQSILKRSQQDLKLEAAARRLEQNLPSNSVVEVESLANRLRNEGQGVRFSDATKFDVGGPVTRPITPFSQPSTPFDRPTTPLDRPTTPLDRPTTPLEGLKWLFDRPTTPYDRPITPYGQSPQNRPVTPLSIQVDSFAKGNKRPTTPLDRPTTPITNPLVRPNYSKDRPITPSNRPMSPLDRPTTPLDRPTTPLDRLISDLEVATRGTSSYGRPTTPGTKMGKVSENLAWSAV